MGAGSLEEGDIDAMVDLAWKVSQKYFSEISTAIGLPPQE